MKPSLLILIVFTLLTLGCKSYVQVIETESTDLTAKNDVFVYETDSLRITYFFWSQNGIMAFAIYNKLDIPLYIDWKKSSYIDNSVKLDYWIDEVTSTTKSKETTLYGGYLYDGPQFTSLVAESPAFKLSHASIKKEERITFLPPQSNYYHSKFHIHPEEYFLIDSVTSSEKVPRNDNPEKITEVYKLTFTKETSPLFFRNFLTFSVSENFESEFYVDNEFYISSIKEMDERHFEQYKRDHAGNTTKINHFKNSRSFYHFVPRVGSVNWRR